MGSFCGGVVVTVAGMAADGADVDAGCGGDLVDVARLADLLGISARRVQQLADGGVVVKAGHGKYRLDESVRSYCEHLREVAAGRDTTLDEKAEKARLIRAQANLTELKIARESKEFLRRADVESMLEQGIAAARIEFMASARRLKKHLEKKHGINIDVGDIIEHHRQTLIKLAEHAPEFAGDDEGGLETLASGGEPDDY